MKTFPVNRNRGEQMNRQKLNDVFPDWLSGGGIFSALQSFAVPWKNNNIAQELDIVYHGVVSGDKFISPMIEKIKTGETLTDVEKTLLSSSILAVFGVNWAKQWTTLSLVYDPIENYRMTETMTDDETVTEYGKRTTRTDNLSHTKTGTETSTPNTTETRTDNLTHIKTGTETQDVDTTTTETYNLTHGKSGSEVVAKDGSEQRTDNLTHDSNYSKGITNNLTDTTTPNLTSSATNSVHGFNSSVAVPSDEQTGTQTGTNTETHTGTVQEQNAAVEHNTGTQTTTQLDNTTTTYSLSDTDTGTKTVVVDGTNETTFNTTNRDSGTQQTTRTGTEQVTYNTVDADTGTQSDVNDGSDTQTRNYELTRSGNIGVTTSQQMIQSERDLWIWNFFYEVVFPDINRVLTLAIY